MEDFKSLKAKLDLLAILRARGLKLKRRGANWFSLCPFHNEKTASFVVNSKKQTWKCYGCGESGDVFDFVQRQDAVDLREAVQRLCQLDLPPPALDEIDRQRTDASLEAADRPPQEVLERVVASWTKGLAQSPRAQEYLKSRGLLVPEILQVFQVGYSSGRLPEMLPSGGKLRQQLADFGILNERGNEFLYGRIVVPLFDEAGALVSVYGRALDAKSQRPHLYLPGRKRGVFNRVGIGGASRVILTESIVDALSLVVLGFANTTASYGVNGFTSELKASLVGAKVERVYCAYDADPAGDQGAESLVRELTPHGIEVWRVRLPVKDANDFIKSGGTREAFEALLAQAVPLARPAATTPPVPRTSSAEMPASTIKLPLEVDRGDRVYRIDQAPCLTRDGLTATLRVSREGRTFVQSLNLYSDHSRKIFLARLSAAFRGQVARPLLEDDLYSLFDDLEALAKQEEAAPPAETMSAQEREEALAFLRLKGLLEAIRADITALGVVGEDDTKLLAYLVAVSRLLEKPLSLSVIARASAGKSWMLNVVTSLVPADHLCHYTRMSPRALFYDEPDRYKHKILFIEEAVGAKEAELGVRSMQSERKLTNLATTTDPRNGKLKTQENVVEGPLTYLTSSVEPLDYETATRCFEVAIDESSEQTARIVESLKEEQTLDGMRRKATHAGIIRRHQNAQRLLEKVAVVNEYARQLSFPSQTLRLRREAGKYFGLIQAVALLHQHQREMRTDAVTGVRYVSVAPEDVDVANRLMAVCLTRALSDLPGPAEELLVRIQRFVAKTAEERGCDWAAVTFNRREIREDVGWSDYQVRLYLAMLVEQEYLEVAAGSVGKRYVYTLPADHRVLVRAGMSIEDRVQALGLTPASKLGERKA